MPMRNADYSCESSTLSPFPRERVGREGFGTHGLRHGPNPRFMISIYRSAPVQEEGRDQNRHVADRKTIQPQPLSHLHSNCSCKIAYQSMPGKVVDLCGEPSTLSPFPREGVAREGFDLERGHP